MCTEKPDVQHAVYKTAVEIDVGVDAFVHASLRPDNLRSHMLYLLIKVILCVMTFLMSKLFYKCLENIRTGIGDRIYSMGPFHK